MMTALLLFELEFRSSAVGRRAACKLLHLALVLPPNCVPENVGVNKEGANQKRYYHQK